MANFVSQMHFNSQYKGQIINDLKDFNRNHRDFKKELKTGDEKYIQFTGSMPLTCGSESVNMQLVIQIYDNYPIEPPTLIFEAQSGQKFNSVPNLKKDGKIDVRGIFEWNSDLKLSETLEKVENYFTSNCPISSGKSKSESKADSSDFSVKKVCDQAIAEAEQIISECNNKSQEFYKLQTQTAMLNHLKKTMEQISQEHNIILDSSQQCLVDRFIQPNLYPIPPGIAGDVEQRAKEAASQSVIDLFREAYIHDPSIETNKFISEYKDMCNYHFKTFVWPRITSK